MKERIKGAFTKKKIFHFLKMALFVVALSLILLSLLGTVAHATGLVDDTINAENLYSKYPLSNYQLDFFVDNSWSWLPWNWLDGIGKSVQYGLYCITNFVWTISLYLSNATGYVVQEAYKLDFINDMADSIGKSIQTLAGVTENGFSSTGFYVGFLLLIILVVGMYVAYTGLIKRETSKALHAVINFVVVFVLSASFIAYAPDYIKKINEFSSDISTASLDLGTKIMLPNSDSEGKDSVDLIRDSLFSIQVEQPWLLLQFGNSNAEEIGTDRVEALVSASPEDEDGKTREEVVKTEIEDNDNNNLTIPQVVNRLGMVFFLLFFNLGITIFVFLLTGMMLFSQILFIIFAMFLPISFLLSMIPSYESMAKQAIVRVFNTIMTRAGITLIVTVAFSISSMFYNISTDYPFFMVAFLQIVCFAGIYDREISELSSPLKEVNDILIILSEMEKTVKESTKKQLKQAQLLENSIQSLTHDIQTPATVVSGNLELLEETNMDVNQKEYVKYAQDGISKISEYVEELKTLSKLEQPKTEYVHFNEKYVDNLILLANQIARLKNVTVSVIQKDWTDDLLIEPKDIQKAFQNIISNAVGFSEKSSQIKLKFINNKSEYIVSVIDNGKGFSKESLEKATQKFYSENKARSGSHYGLGLSIVEKIMNEHSGFLQIENLEVDNIIVGAKVSLIFKLK